MADCGLGFLVGSGVMEDGAGDAGDFGLAFEFVVGPEGVGGQEDLSFRGGDEEAAVAGGVAGEGDPAVG